MRPFELYLAHVARWHRAHFVDHIHQHLGAHFRQPFASDRIAGQYFFRGRGGLHELAAVANIADPLGAAHGDGLQILRGHHGAHARTPRRAMQIVDHPGIQHALFRRATHAGDTEQWILMPGVQEMVRLPARLAPQPFGGEKFGLVIFQIKVDRCRRFAFEDDHVEASVLDLVTDKATGVGARNGARQRALGDHRVSSTGRGHGAGERSRRHDEFVAWRQRIDFRIDFFGQILRGQSTLA